MSTRWGPLLIEGCPVNPVGPLILTCGAKLTNVSDQGQIVVATDQRGDAAGAWRLAPGESVWLTSPPSGAWRVTAAPVQALVTRMDEVAGTGLVVGLALVAGAFWLGRVTGTGGERHGR